MHRYHRKEFIRHSMRYLFSFAFLLAAPGCSLLKLDKESNCLNDKALCFKADKTPPQFSSSAPDISKQYTVLDYIDLTFSEEVKNGESTSAYSLSGTGFNTGYKIQFIQKIAQYTYRVYLGGASLKTGNIDLSFSGLVDYGGNSITGPTTVSYQGSSNVPISLSVTYSGAVVNGVSNNGGGAYGNVDISFYHQFTADNANNYTIYLTTGATVCSGTVIGTGTSLAANVTITPINKVATFFPSALNRIVVCVTNQNNPTATGSASWALIRDDVPPVMSNDIPPDNYPSAQNIALTCSDNMDKIAYTVATQQGSAPAPPGDPGFDATGNLNATSSLYVGALNAGNPANPTYTIFSWQCLDKSGNRSALTASVTKGMQYYVDSTIPAVNFANDSTFRAYIGPVNTSTTLKFTTDQANRTYNIRRNGTTCTGGGDGTLLATGTTPATTGTVISQALNTTTHFTTANSVYPVRICVAGPTAVWGTGFIQITRDDTAPVITPTVTAGTYGAVQSVVFNCTDTNLDKAVYRYSTQLGNVPPVAPSAPTFNTSTGAVTSAAPNYTGSFSTPDSSTSVALYGCIDLAGNQASGGPVQYTVDSAIPSVTVVNVDRTAVTSNAGGYNSVNITWNTTRAGTGYAGNNYDIRVGATDCITGSIVASGLTPATAGQNIVTNLTAANFPTNGTNYAIKICVKNYAGSQGYQTSALSVMRDDTVPTFSGLSGIASAGTGNYTISWPAATDSGSGPAFYRIYQSTFSLTYGTTPDYIVAAPNTNFTVTGLTPGTTYYFVAGAVDNAGNETKVVTLAAEMRTRFNLSVSVAGKTASTNPFVVRSGSDVLTFTTTGSQTFATGFLSGSSYSVTVNGQPENQNCAFTQNQYGTLNADVTLNVTCTAGYLSSGSIAAKPAVPLNYMLYRGNAQVIAGSGTAASVDNIGLAAQFNSPHGMAYANGFLYVTETSGHRIRKIDLSNNSVTTLAGSIQGANDGTGTGAQFASPFGITTDGANLYVAENGVGGGSAGRIRRIVIATGVVTTIAGGGTGGGTACPGGGLGGCLDGNGSQATFVGPNQLIYYNGFLYVSEYSGSRVRRMDLSTGQVITIAGDGTAATSTDNATGTSATFNGVTGAAVAGGSLYVADFNGHRIRKINLTAPYAVSTVAGTSQGYADGSSSVAKFNNPDHLTSDGRNLFIAEFSGNRIRRIDLQTSIVSTIAGDGTGTDASGVGIAARFNQPVGIVTDGARLYVGAVVGHQIFKISDSGLVGYWPLAGNAEDYASDVASQQAGIVYGSPVTTGIDRFGNAGIYTFDGVDDYISAAGTNLPTGNAARTLCGWVNIPDTTNTANDGVITYGRRNANTVFGIRLGGPQQFFAWDANGDLDFKMTATVSKWTHTCTTHDGATTRVYLNGHWLDQSAKSYSTSAGNICFGQRSNPSGTNLCDAGGFFFKGLISDVRVYNRVLNEGEINELAQDAVQAQVGNGFNSGATGLLSHYNYDSASVNDYGALNNSLTAGTGSSVIGKDGDASGAYYFSGAGSNFHSTASIGQDGTANGGEITASAWINPSAYPTSGNIMPIVTRTPMDTTGYYLELYNVAGTQLIYWSSQGSASATYATYQVPLNSWTHIAVSHSGGVAKIYVNGVAQSTTVSNGPPSLVPAGSATPLYIGKRADGPVFSGKIDDVRIYNNALTAAQIRQLATQVPVGLAARFDFNTDLTDVAGFGNVISASGTPTATNDRLGQSGTAYSFSSGAKFGKANPVMQNLDNVTLTAWFRPLAYSGSAQYIVINGGGGDGYGVFIDGSDGNVIKGILGGLGYLRTTVVPPLNVWSHIAMVRTNGTWTIHLNGVSLPLTGISVTTTTAPTMPVGGSYIGLDAGSTLFFNGDIDDVRFYTLALGSADIRALVGYHPMQVTTWNATPGSSSLKFFLQPEVATYASGGCSGGANCVSAWNDSSGNGFNVAQGTAASQPVFNAAGINGRPTVKFVQSAATFLTGTCNMALNSANSTFFSVFQEGNQAGNNGIFQSGTFAPGGGKLIYFIYNPRRGPSLFDLGAGGAGALNLWDSDPSVTYNISGEAVIMSLDFNGTSGNLYKNGLAVTKSQAASAGYNCGSGALHIGRYYYGGVYPGDGGYFDGHLADFLFFNSILTGISVYGAPYTDREVVQCYLSAKYSIPLGSGVICP